MVHKLRAFYVPFLLIRIMGNLNHASDHFQQLQLVLVIMTLMKAAEYYTVFNQPPKCNCTNIPALSWGSKLTGFHSGSNAFWLPQHAATVMLTLHTKVFTETHTTKSSTWWWQCAETAAWSPHRCPGRSRGPPDRMMAAEASYSDGLKKTQGGKKEDMNHLYSDLLQPPPHISLALICILLVLFCVQSLSQLKSNNEAWKSPSRQPLTFIFISPILQAPGPRLCDSSSLSLLSSSRAFFSSSSCFFKSSAVVAFTAV